MKKQTCAYCERPAEYLCDFVLRHGWFSQAIADAIAAGRELTSEEWGQAICNPDEVFMETCDRPLCEIHRHFVGNVFYDGDAKHTFMDSRDMCPGHAGIPGGHKPPPGWAGRANGPGRGKRMAA